MVGLFWSLALQWPDSIESLFLRRCPLAEATRVAVVAPVKKVELSNATELKASFAASFVRLFWYPFDFLFRLLFSYPSLKPGFQTYYCKVDAAENSFRSFYCQMGRYVYNASEKKYIPGTMHVGTTVGDFLSKKTGLTTEQANDNYNLVGPNIIPIEKPTIYKCIVKEFSKTFYVYQNFLVWSWFPYWYYFMAIINTFLRLTGGLIGATSQYLSESVSYKLSSDEGQVVE